MITKLTNSNRSLYMDLFLKAETLLNGAKPGEEEERYIYDLDTYFQNLRELVDLDYSFLRLPLDEPCFEIVDDNSHRRYIQIPDTFNKNGISVQGDENAEILWFSIDRYYDSFDLMGPSKADIENNNAMPVNIMIQWETSLRKGVSPAFVAEDGRPFLDADGKLYFGWPVTSEITKEAGSVKFNVRFYQFSGKKEEDNTPRLSFGLNTQTATVKVNPGIVYAITGQEKYEEGDLAAFENGVDVITGKNALIVNRIQDSSKFNSESLENSATPKYLIDVDVDKSLGKFSTYVEVEEGTILSETDYEILDLDPDTKSLSFQVFAIPSEGAGMISYTSYASESFGGIQGQMDSIAGGENIFKLVTEVDGLDADIRIDGVRYYEINEEGNYVVVTEGLPNGGDAWGEKNVDEDGKCKYFVKLSPIYTVNEPGFYYIISRNAEGKNKNHAYLDSKKVCVPAAKQLQDDSLTITNGEADFLNDEGKLTLEATVDNSTKIYDYNTIVSQWSQDGTPITGANELTYEISIEEDQRKLYDEIFSIACHTERNNSETEDIKKEIRVTSEPTPFTFIHKNKNEDGEDITENIRVNAPEISVIFNEEDVDENGKFNFVCDSIKYRWFVSKYDKEDIQAGIDIEENDERVYPPLPAEGEEDTPWIVIENVNNTVPEIKLPDANVDQYYYCEIVNCVNGHESAEKNYTEYITMRPR